MLNDLHHQILERDVTKYAESRGWLVGAGTYHDAMPQPVVNILRKIDTPMGLYVRGRSDRVAVRGNRCHLFETKTTNHEGSDRIPIEMLPLACHIELARSFDVAVLYVCRMVHCGFECGFFTSHPPVPAEFIIPAWRWALWQQMWFHRIMTRVWPGVPISIVDNMGRSGDPFGWFSRNDLDAVGFDWRTVFDEEFAPVKPDDPAREQVTL